MKNILFFVLVSALTLACDTGGSSKEIETSIVKSPVQLQDGNGEMLGHVITAGLKEPILILTPKKYLVSIYWDRSFNQDSIYFTEPDGDGTAFFSSGKTPNLYGKSVFHGCGTFYIPAKISSKTGLSIPDGSIREYGSQMDWDGSIMNFDPPVTINSPTYVLKTATREEIGLPEIIELPLNMVITK